MTTLGSSSVLLDLPSQADVAQAVAGLVGAALRDDIMFFRRASIAVTVAPETRAILPYVFSEEVDWRHTSVGLVSDFVTSGRSDDMSALRKVVKTGASRRAEFLPLNSGMRDPQRAAKMSDNAYLPHLPLSFTLLTLEAHGSLRSWGGDASGAVDFIGPSDRAVAWRADGAGGYHLGLTRAALAQSRRAAIVLSGAAQRQMFIEAMKRSTDQAPICGIVEDLGPRLVVFCAP